MSGILHHTRELSGLPLAPYTGEPKRWSACMEWVSVAESTTEVEKVTCEKCRYWLAADARERLGEIVGDPFD